MCADRTLHTLDPAVVICLLPPAQQLRGAFLLGVQRPPRGPFYRNLARITRLQLVARLDVNIPLAQNFVRMFCKRTLEGQILPWLATRQGLMGYILSRSVCCRLPLAAAAACCLFVASLLLLANRKGTIRD